MPLRSKIRSILPPLLGRVAEFRGKGRITLLIDRLLTNTSDADSYEVTGYLNDGICFTFDLRPWGQKFAYYYRDWEGDHVYVLKKLYCGDVFLDVGSSLGLFVASMGNTIRSLGGSIISVEPVPFNLEKQKKNVAANDLDDLVTYVPHALGKEWTVVRINTDPIKADNNAIISDYGDLEIEVMPLDDLAMEGKWGRIGMVKMDVEGYEPMVIEGAKATIKRDMPIIFAEFCRERMDINAFSMSSSWQFLVGELGYVCYVMSGGKRKLCLIDDPGRAENLFFLPSDTLVPADLIV